MFSASNMMRCEDLLTSSSCAQVCVCVVGGKALINRGGGKGKDDADECYSQAYSTVRYRSDSFEKLLQIHKQFKRLFLLFVYYSLTLIHMCRHGYTTNMT